MTHCPALTLLLLRSSKTICWHGQCCCMQQQHHLLTQPVLLLLRSSSTGRLLVLTDRQTNKQTSQTDNKAHYT